VNIHQPVLLLNAAWQPLGTVPLFKALADMNSIRSPKLALKIEYFKDEKGAYHLDQPTEIIPLRWDEWITLSPREFDEESVRTPNMEIRVPTVVITKTYNKIPKKMFRPTKRNLYEKYKGVCYWTGEKLSFSEMTIEHVVSKDEWRQKSLDGSPNTWKNLAPAHPKVNHLKGNMSPEEFQKKHGYKPQYKLEEPKPIPASILIRAIKPDWAIFTDK
jgi:5-methylcytosine-specific restriction endonuclease McrA